MATESTDRDFIVDPVIHEALENGTVDPDGLRFYRCKFNDAGEFFGVTQVEETA